ncbi:MAG: T9SS type A sorting domain-containing protein [Bacteroidota bacterium]
MKHIFLCSLWILLCFGLQAQSSRTEGEGEGRIVDPGTIGEPIPQENSCICYSYDAAGNRIQRKLCIEGPSPLREGTDVQVQLDQSIKVYPNPTQNMVLVELSQEVEGAKLYLMDLSGRHLKQHKLEGLTAKFDLSAYPAGTYILMLRSPDVQQQWRVVKTD